MSIVTVGTSGPDYADFGARSKMVMTPYGIMSLPDWIERKKKDKREKKLLAPKPIIHKNTVEFDDTEALKE